MFQLRRAWLLASLVLFAIAITVRAAEADVPITKPAETRLGCFTSKSLQALEDLKLYAFRGLADDVKPREWPEFRPSWRVASSVVLLFIGASICSAGGIGGGGLFIPIFNLLLGFDPKASAALSNFVILGGSCANLIRNLPQRHPLFPHKPIINYDVALLLQPNMLLGISIGVICNVMFPGWLIIAQLAVILGYITFRSFSKGLNQWQVESQLVAAKERRESGDGMERGEEGDVKVDRVRAREAEEANSEVEEPLWVDRNVKNSSDEGLLSPLLAPAENCPEAAAAAGFRYGKIVCLGLVWLAFFVIQLLRGSKSAEGVLPLESCGLGYWLLTGSQIPLAMLVTVWAALRHPTRCSSQEQEAGEVSRGRALTLFPAMAMVAGLLGGMLGVGGGMIMNPLLMETGMHPQVTAATTSFMVFFSSSLSVVEFWLLGRLPLDFALFFAALCFVASLVGLSVVQHAIAKHGRTSIIIFSVALVMGVSAVMMAGFGSLDVYRQYRQGDYMGFHTPCG